MEYAQVFWHCKTTEVVEQVFDISNLFKGFRKGLLNENTTTANEITTVTRPRITGMTDCTPQNKIRTLTPLTRMEHSYRIIPKCKIVHSCSLVKPGAIQLIQGDLSSQHIGLCFISDKWLHKRLMQILLVHRVSVHLRRTELRELEVESLLPVETTGRLIFHLMKIGLHACQKSDDFYSSDLRRCYLPSTRPGL